MNGRQQVSGCVCVGGERDVETWFRVKRPRQLDAKLASREEEGKQLGSGLSEWKSDVTGNQT